MKNEMKSILKAWGCIILWIIGVILFLHFTGCSLLEKGAKTELNEHTDKRINAAITQLKNGSEAREITENGLKQIGDHYIAKGIGFGFAGGASWLAAFFGLRYRQEKKKNKKE